MSWESEIIDNWIATNESFRGTVLDEKKMEKLNRMKSVCQEVTSLTSELKSPLVPLDNHRKTASVILRGQHPVGLLDSRVAKKIAELWNMADTVSMAIPEGTDEIQMCFTLWDMWSEWTTSDDTFAKDK